jgi:predicted dehydrogenase
MSERADGLRVGVVGLGYWGSKHLRALRSVGSVASIVGIDERYGSNGQMHIDSATSIDVFSRLSDALPRLDALIVATPASSHSTIGTIAIEAGKHVLIEKPMTTSAVDAVQLIHAAEAAGVVLMVGHTFEHSAAVKKLRDVVGDPRFGRLRYLHCARLNLGLYRDDVNVIFDVAAHDVSIANFIIGGLPDSVETWAERHVHPYQEDVAHLSLRYPDIDVNVNIHASWLDPIKVRRITAVGTAQMATYDDLAENHPINIYDSSVSLANGTAGISLEFRYNQGRITSPDIPIAEPLVTEDQHFIDCIVSDARPSTDGRSGLAVVQVLECAQISLRERRTAFLSEVGRRGIENIVE